MPDFRSEGAIYPLEISLAAANRTLTEKLQLTVPAGGAAPPAKPETSSDKAGKEAAGKPDAGSGQAAVLAGFAAVVLLGAGGWFWRRRRTAGSGASGAENTTIPAAGEPKPAEAVPPGLPPALPAQPTPGVLVRLTRIHEGPPPNQFELEIDSGVIIGSDPRASHLVLDTDSRIAPAHCEIVFAAGRLYIRDLGTAQGTFLNGAAVTGRQVIEEQDVLRLGATELQITFPVGA